MTSIKDASSDFLAHQRIAVTGVSRNPKSHAANLVYTRLRDRGYDVFAVNPNADEVEGGDVDERLDLRGADEPAGLDGGDPADGHAGDEGVGARREQGVPLLQPAAFDERELQAVAGAGRQPDGALPPVR